MSIAYKYHMSEQDYLSSELTSPVKREFIAGEVFAMVGASSAHNLITGNMYAALHQHLRGKPCRPYTNDMKVRIAGDYYYPDVLVDCSELADDDYATHTPILIIEVLSQSTKIYDKTFKRERYQQIPTLQEYVMIEQETAVVEVLRRMDSWQPHYYGLGERFRLESIGLEMSVEEVYERINNEDMRAWRAQSAG
ncbi:Uma2 family endonuclease [Alkanindiges sp. WGS2144]|uniref:Uma2 family endonuclease n=1 Tax=Alkanindiges sp. WGS2144 TaxID=3366808 RepID=UPI003753888A